MRRRTLLYLIVLLPCLLQAADDLLRFRVYLKDKNTTAVSGYVESQSTNILQSGSKMSMFALSSASIVRRQRQNIDLDSTDLPINESYLKTIRSKGLSIVTQSHWMNTVVVSAPDSSCIDSLITLPFVESVKLVWVNPKIKSDSTEMKATSSEKFKIDTLSIYGKANTQIKMLNLDALHSDGYKGASKLIAVIDAGFCGVDTMSWFKNLSLVAARDFVYPPTSIYNEQSHGTSVLSILAANKDYSLIGSAPEAGYCLLRSEDGHSEFPIEEDYWAAAAEFADSIGADIITSSLGYSEFDVPSLSYNRGQLDGQSAFITRVANVAASKGLFVVISAGNDGARAWRKIGFPADAENVLTVGAVQSDGKHCTFSSFGPTADGRIKPDVVALGVNNFIVNGVGMLTSGSGTSFSAPLVAGLSACLWDAHPELKASELMKYIKESASQAISPDSINGYGVPDARKIMQVLAEPSISVKNSIYYCYPNPAKDKLYFSDLSTIEEPVNIAIYSAIGQKMIEKKLIGEKSYLDISHLPDSIYLVEFMVSGERKFCQKIIIHK